MLGVNYWGRRISSGQRSANREEYSHSKKIENSAGERTAEVLNGTGLPRGALWASPQNELAAILGLMAFLHMKVNAVQQ